MFIDEGACGIVVAIDANLILMGDCDGSLCAVRTVRIVTVGAGNRTFIDLVMGWLFKG